MSEQLKKPIWTKDFIFNFVVSFVIFLSMYLLLVTVGGYSKETFGVSDSLAGLASGLFIVGSLIGRFLTGKYINIVGTKKVLIIGGILLVITNGLYFVSASSFALLLIVRILNGIASGVASTATGTIAAFITPAQRRSEGISMYSLSMVLGTAIGPFIGLLLYQHIPMTGLFTICTILIVIAFVMSIFMKIDTPVMANTNEEKKGFRLSDFYSVHALPIAIVVVIVSIAYSSVLSFIQFFAQENHLVDAASFFFVVYAIAVLLTRPFTGKIMDQRGENIVAIPAFICLVIGLFLISIASNGVVLLIAGAFVGLGFGNLQSIFQALVVKVSPVEAMGLATSTYFIGLDFGLGFGPYVLGNFTNSIGYSGLYLAMALVALLGLVAFYFLHMIKAKKEVNYYS
ncbi:MFS transporter [Mammaliicoccus vitulinus]|uniref:MFS transporter n=1 Tax=Mammaliicoccus vitulinus TaxID=71237 RepID=UPI000D1D31B9|nr:MFS transporter [Mammaliicoccus vitulinus]MEB7657282.1 MFS transporter [Mammaliicoccus vitulinus]PTI89412.1 MFS transporter [Mammaliicoccus vitulinus]QJF25882.1 MFS transporter [Mammaliicoccus vitulinus]QQT14700.1 MFS transporter [Mammaliicoccus vitulinus]QQY20001.1 MFS transporter [Mammaliicoccus vitulinus]